jgi:Small nuclear ribonucleoprotein (snRNP) homolog
MDNTDESSSPAIHRLKYLLRQTLRITITDGRVLIGSFVGTDKPLNILLINTEEYRIGQDENPDGRYIGQVLIPWRLVVKAEAQNGGDHEGTKDGFGGIDSGAYLWYSLKVSHFSSLWLSLRIYIEQRLVSWHGPVLPGARSIEAKIWRSSHTPAHRNVVRASDIRSEDQGHHNMYCQMGSFPIQPYVFQERVHG